MKKLTDIGEVKRALERHGIVLSKGLGQNFLINPTVCPRMAEYCGADDSTGVLEIGPGIGVLTVELAKLAKRVVAIELDERLKPLLEENLEPYPNAQVVWGDAMKLNLPALIEEHFSDCRRVVVCANLPYYITSPIIMMLLEQRLPIESITVMVQKEAAERMCAPVGSRESGAVTVAVHYHSVPSVLFSVSAGSFLPAPKVDSAVMKLEVLQQPPVDAGDEKQFRRLIKAGFSQRRKTLLNAVSAGGFSKEAAAAALDEMGLPRTARLEQLTLEQLAHLNRCLS
ncbi:MAG: ribosomal RNA small subunit methyltransferase A [Ruminococcaceae bacterium]|nr:ribosomal RNA small subunit methyltransferase A [Oscillospiraceae bacterium]